MAIEVAFFNSSSFAYFAASNSSAVAEFASSSEESYLLGLPMEASDNTKPEVVDSILDNKGSWTSVGIRVLAFTAVE